MNEINASKIGLVVFDWAGTVVDYGCVAPAIVFQKVFEQKGIELTREEILKPMGMEKKDHICELLRMEHVTAQWRQQYGKTWGEEDVDSLYCSFEEMLDDVVADYSTVMSGVEETVKWLRDSGIVIGSTTGYTTKIMKKVCKRAAKDGYVPDYVVTPDITGNGRPEPFMIYENMRLADVYPADRVVKVGDTVMDILEGKNAGVWTVGVLEGSSLAGLSLEESNKLSAEEKAKLYRETKDIYIETGADFVIDKLSELPSVIETLGGKKETLDE